MGIRIRISGFLLRTKMIQYLILVLVRTLGTSYDKAGAILAFRMPTHAWCFSWDRPTTANFRKR